MNWKSRPIAWLSNDEIAEALRQLMGVHEPDIPLICALYFERAVRFHDPDGWIFNDGHDDLLSEDPLPQWDLAAIAR
ncbi:MAG: hypothetical protein M0026_14595 [Nocardiopsaceae bacterium]|nr:hypothetical protein [Nocardiopsaceae bacterium]